MALRVSPERVRDVRFAEQWRGYRTDEVDEFVEQVAEALDQLEGRLEEAAQRTALAERRLDERGPDEDLRRTLILAQRTADAALEEAKAEAARMVADAEETARSILTHLEERKARIEGEIEARISVELGQLGDRRAELEADVERLVAYVEDHRCRLAQELRAHLGWLEKAGPLEPLPAALERPELPDGRPTLRSDTAAEEVVGGPADGDALDSVERDSAEHESPEHDGAEHESPEHNSAEHDDPTGVAADVSYQDDDTALDDLDVIPWGDPSADEDTTAGVPAVEHDDSDDDPFITELRRAVDDPEPLGPRDEAAEWKEDVDLYRRHKEGPMRSRRRRRS
jgi:DivIVA domain-containing protein